MWHRDADGLFDKVIAANVIHLLDEPLKALAALDRVCKPGGQIIIPTYINREYGEYECVENGYDLAP